MTGGRNLQRSKVVFMKPSHDMSARCSERISGVAVKALQRYRGLALCAPLLYPRISPVVSLARQRLLTLLPSEAVCMVERINSEPDERRSDDDDRLLQLFEAPQQNHRRECQ